MSIDFPALKPDTLVAITSVALTAMSLIVAAVALLFSYRQNVGWKPIILTSEHGMQGTVGREFELVMGLEFWNRRRYPVSVRVVRIDVGDTRIRPVDGKGREDWFFRKNYGHKVESVVIEPHQRHVIPIIIPLQEQSLDALRPLLRFQVDYFDPYLKRHDTRRLDLKFFYPDFGWKLSKKERAERIAAWEANQKMREKEEA